MPQKPTMPSPYMATIDATEPITFSCTIDNRDTIVDYEFNIEEIGSIKDTSNNDNNQKIVLPPIYVGSVNISVRSSNPNSTYTYTDYIRLYKENLNSAEYVMVVEEVENPINLSGRIGGKATEFELSNGQTINTDNIVKIIQISDTRIRELKYSNFPNLREVQIFGEVKEVEGKIFSGSNSIKEFVFPDSLKTESVSTDVFLGNQSIEKITIPCLTVFDGYRIPKVKSVVVKNINPYDDNGYTDVIGEYSYKSGSSIKVKQYYPFRNNTKLEEVIFQSSVSKVARESFAGCTSLKKIVGIEDVKIIDHYAFEDCENLSYFFNEQMSVESIGVSAFENSGLKQLIITEKMKTIDSYAFRDCKSLGSIVVITTPSNITITTSAFQRLNDLEITVYGKDDVTATELYSIIVDSFSNVNFESLYNIDGYTPVPLRGGSTLQRTVNANFLENDKEYYWNVNLTDSFGKTLTTPNYYFRTRSNPTVSISKMSTEVTEVIDEFDYDKDGTISALFTDHNILDNKSYYIDFTPSVSLFSETTSLNSYYAEDNKIMSSVGTSVVFTGESKDIDLDGTYYENDNGIGTINLFRLPIREGVEALYKIEANLHVTETLETDDGTEEISNNKSFIVWLKRGANQILEPGIESTDPETFTIVCISTHGTTETFSGTINLESGAEYQISYNTGFASNGTYTVSYSYESDIQSYTHTFTGEYDRNDEFSDFIPLKSYRWRLYEVTLDKQYLVDDTGTMYGSYLSYTYSRFVPDHKYRLCLEVENDEGVTGTTAYEFSTGNYASVMQNPVEISLDKGENAVKIKIEDASVFYSVIRFNIEKNEYKLIAKNIRGAGTEPRYIYDYTAASNTGYRYTVYALNSDDEFSVWTSGKVVPDWCKTSVIGFYGSYTDNSPIEVKGENVWSFGLNMEDITYKQNMSKTISQGIGSRYAHVTTGNTNYKAFDISCLLGDVDNIGYTSDTAIKAEKWCDFVASPMAKLVVDIKGNITVCDATDSSVKSEGGYNELPTTISASFTEIAPSDKISIYRIKDGE